MKAKPGFVAVSLYLEAAIVERIKNGRWEDVHSDEWGQTMAAWIRMAIEQRLERIEGAGLPVKPRGNTGNRGLRKGRR